MVAFSLEKVARKNKISEDFYKKSRKKWNFWRVFTKSREKMKFLKSVTNKSRERNEISEEFFKNHEKKWNFWRFLQKVAGKNEISDEFYK